MTDEVKPEALKPAEEISTPEAPAEQTPVEAPAEPVEEPVEAPAPAEAETEPKPSRKEKRQSRLATINQQLREQNTQAPVLPPAEQPQPKPLSELLRDKEEIAPQELDAIANDWVAQNQPNLNNIEALVDLKLSQKEAFSTARSEIGEVTSREEFNSDSDSYNPNLEKAVLRTWEKAARVIYDKDGAVVSFDPTVSIKTIADDITDAAKSYSQQNAAGLSAALSQQADEGAVTGGTQTAKTKTKFEDKSIEEMEAQLGFHRT